MSAWEGLFLIHNYTQPASADVDCACTCTFITLSKINPEDDFSSHQNMSFFFRNQPPVLLPFLSCTQAVQKEGDISMFFKQL